MSQLRNALMKLRLALLAVVLLSAYGCGGGGGGGSAAPNTNPTIASGVVSKGLLNGSNVCAYAITGGAKGALIGSCTTTDAGGNYSINLGTYTGPVLFQATGGTYVDEATGATVTLASPMDSMLLNATGGNVSVAITALTELAYQNADALAGGLTNANMQSAITSIQNNFGVSDIVNTMPVDALNVPTGATAAQKTYALAMATISEYLNGQPGTTLATALQTMQTCLAAPATGCGTGATSLGTLLNTALNTFETGHSAFSGITLPVTTFGAAPTLSSVAVTPANPSVAVSSAQQFTATGTYSDSSTKNLTTTATWNSATTSVATISNTAGSNGQATTLATGTSMITATVGNVSGKTTLTVTQATLVSIAVTPANPSVAVGATQQFTATGTFSDNSKQDITTTVTWSSGTTSMATISNTTGSSGLLTALAAGTSTITATSGSVTTSTTLTATATQVSGLNAPVEITVAFESGATIPTTVKAFTPNVWDGDLCLPSSLEFVGQTFPATTSYAGGFYMYVKNNCSAASNPSFYLCTPVGAPTAQDGIQVCATAPLQTPASALGAGYGWQNDGGLVGPFTNTAGVTSLVIFYCASGDTVVAPPAASDVSCKKL